MTDSELCSILSDRLASVRGRLADACRRSGRDPTEARLVAVTKSVPLEVAGHAFGLGAVDLGESRPQELWKKASTLAVARWHLVGHLQRNKIDRTVPLVSLIHSVDSERLLEALDAFGRSRGAPVRVLLEVNCSREEAKGGFRPEETFAVAERMMSLAGLSPQGLMTMAAHHEDPERSRPTFAELRKLRDRLQAELGVPLPDLSMGMSNDFEIAAEEGATLVRVGTALFEGLSELQ